MNENKTIHIIVSTIALLAGVVAFCGIFSDHGDGSFIYQSLQGQNVNIYGKGLYQHMPADVAIQALPRTT